ncbi:threonine/serine ThrE exporter family protein [Nesterenkonia sp. HG001]|uniref:threonine/serine ThrE exporter family protein n=1 Tax=Nesterenkonia sp. HG001 TaxID=2983207 RepID=UPI002AC47840|nr:threonine/serine exporter family protein [Nesterenkonia sp. HG001]MDZ5078929.1 threonine/serine exporter family protein [Nesterenkonia sp. HG001]
MTDEETRRQDHTGDQTAADAAVEAIDPVISEPDAEVTLIPVVRPTAEGDVEDTSTGFMRALTGSIASSWQAAREAEATLEWEEFDTEAVERAQEEAAQAEAEAVRHEYVPDAFYDTPAADLPDAGQHPGQYPGQHDVGSATSPTSPIPRPHTHSFAALREPPADRQPDELAAGEWTPSGDWAQTEALGPQIPTDRTPVADPYEVAVSPLSEPIRRRSVLRPTGAKLPGPLRRAPLFDRSVFDQKVRPQDVLRRIMRLETTHTQSVPLVDHLAGTPYANPRQAEQPVDSDELATIAFVLDLGEALFRYGAGALEVETSIIAVTAAFGMKNTDVDITNQSISLNWAPDDKIPYSRVRVVRSWSRNYKALAAVHELVTDIISGRLTRTESAERLQEITREPKPYPRWMVTLAGAVFASLFASFLGAPMLDASIGFAATLVVLGINRQLAVWRVPEFFTLATGGFVATFIAMGAFMLGVPITPSMVVAGGLMILLPSARVVSAIQDAINGFPLTSAGRLVSAMIAFAGMTAGIMAGVVLADLLGAPQMEIAVGLTRLYHPAVLVAIVFVAAMAAAVVEQARWKMLLPTGLVSALGFLLFYAGESIGLGERMTPILGATVVGALGRVVALRMGAPQLVIAVPGMMFMLPGLMVFRGMYQIALENPDTNLVASMMGGLTELFSALIIILGIASGIVLGDVLMRPITAGLQSNERSRGRRR